MKTKNPFPLGKYIYIFNYVSPNIFGNHVMKHMFTFFNEI